MSPTRREFLQQTVTAAGSLYLGSSLTPLRAEAPKPIPRRRLGRTGVQVGIVGLGLAPLGMGGYSPQEFEATVNTALAAGINYFDVQPNYGKAEQYFAPLLRRHRDRIFVVTKTWETTREKALRALTASLEQLAIPQVDAIFLNNIGLYDLDQLFKPEGTMAALKELRGRGKTRFLGLSGHMGTGHFVKALETGEFDIVMAPLNFVDRHIYSFEHDILPAAEKHGAAVVAMKVLGGAVGLNYETREQTAKLSPADHEAAIRYALGLHGMCCALIGCKNEAEVQAAAQAARNYRPLDAGELAALHGRGKELAAQWGKHYPED